MSKPTCGKEVHNVGNDTQKWSENIEAVNRSMLHNSVRDAGLYAYGTIGVEVWVLDESRTLLVQPSGGFWFDEAFACTACEAFHRLTKPERPDYVSAKALAPGVGLGGTLWSEASFYSQSKRFSYESDDNDEESQRSMNPIILSPSGRALKMVKRKVQRVVWRDIKALALDPDQPMNPRLELLGKAGFGLAAGVPFRTTNERGIVVYLARNTVDTTKLKNIKNEEYLLRATEFIGAVWSLRGPRREAIKERIEERKLVKKRVRSKLLKLLYANVTIEELVKKSKEKKNTKTPSISEDNTSIHSRITTITENTKQRLKSNIKKSRGANVHLAPTVCTSQFIFILFGSFITLIGKKCHSLYTFFKCFNELYTHPIILFNNMIELYAIPQIDKRRNGLLICSRSYQGPCQTTI